MDKHRYPVKATENEVVLFSGKCTTNSTSNPDGLSGNILSVTRTAAGKFTVVIKEQYRCPQVEYIAPPTLVGAAGYDVYLTSVDKDGAATSTVTADTKANTTDDDYFTIHDGYAQYSVVLDVAGDGSALGLDNEIVADISGDTTAIQCAATVHAAINAASVQITSVDNLDGTLTLTQDNGGTIGNRGQQEKQVLSNSWAITNMTGGYDGVKGFKFETHVQSGALVAATGTVTFDTKANSTDGDYFVLNDGQKRYGFELDVSGDGASRAATGVAATATITCGTKAQAANDGDYYIINDGQERYCFELDADGGGATLVLGGTTDYGNSITAVDISSDTTAADVAATLKTAIDSTSIQVTVTDNADGTLTLANEYKGAHGNTQNIEAVVNAAYLITDFTGGTDPVAGVDVWTNVDISGATTAADVGTLALASINGTDIQITASENGGGTPNGTLNLVNDSAGGHGNTQQEISETGTTLFAITDMTGGSDGTSNVAADTNDYDVYFYLELRNSKKTFK